ncbi:hypothetical protein HDU87_001589 [Geranomyces variabilis]|uniref:ParB/Sulfiredoxin domain-containing protein n=1 Tax=Geranomyces variabilis TaxID=109894 RepID=A0AAD5TM95_9FUNG|nr:hypothetical protein HDU87_001589 [Geranomyces variabilis]
MGGRLSRAAAVSSSSSVFKPATASSPGPALLSPTPSPPPPVAHTYERWRDIAKPRPFNPATHFPGFLPPRPLGPTRIRQQQLQEQQQQLQLQKPQEQEEPMHTSVAPPNFMLGIRPQQGAVVDASFGYGQHPVSLAVNVSRLPPASLVPHESTNSAHLALLTRYLATLPPDTPVPLAAVTKSFPHVILDGHHRVAAARALGLNMIPVWVVDDEAEDNNSSSSSSKALQPLQQQQRQDISAEVRCFDAHSGERILLKTVAGLARAGGEGFGVKGTRHVVLGPRGEMRLLEEVTPRLPWADWTRGTNATAVAAAAATAVPPLASGGEATPETASMFALDPPR